MSSKVPLSTTDLSIWRFCAWGGPVFILGCGIGFFYLAGFLPPPPEYLNAQQITQYYLDHNLGIRSGMIIMLMASGSYLLWTVVMSAIMKRVEGANGLLSNIELLGGLFTVGIVQGFALMFLVASFRTPERTPQEILLLNDAGWMIVNITFMPTALQMIAWGTAWIMDKRVKPLVPWWVGWVSFALVATFMPIVAMPFLINGPFAWHGLLTFWIALGAYFVWLFLASYYTFSAIRTIEIEERM